MLFMNKKSYKYTIPSKPTRLTNRYIFLLLIYFIAWGIMLFNGGTTGDGQRFSVYPDKSIIGDTIDHGLMLVGDIYVYLRAIGNYLFGSYIFFFRALIFTFYLITGLIFYHLMLQFRNFCKLDAFFVAAIFLVFPCNEARIVTSYIFYAYGLMFFMLGILAMHYAFKNTNYLLRAVSLLLFYFSFIINSLLVFYCIPILYLFGNDGGLWSKNRTAAEWWQVLCKWILLRLDFFILPILFFVLKKVFYGKYIGVGYNMIDMHRIVGAFFTTFFQPIILLQIVQASLLPISFSSMCIGIVLANFLISKQGNMGDVFMGPQIGYSLYYEKIMLIIGMFLFYIGVFPYMVVMDNIGNTSPDSHNQLLIGFGAAFICFYSIRPILARLFSRVRFTFVLLTLLAVFIRKDIQYMFSYQLDWIKQEQLKGWNSAYCIY